VEPKSVRVLVGLIACGLICAAARPGLACEAMIGREYTDPPEVAQLDLDRSQWHVGRRLRDEGRARIEYLKAAETTRDWTELVTWQVTFGKQDPDRSMREFLRMLRYQCPELESRTVRQTESELIFEWWHSGCFGRPAQHELVRLVSGLTGGHMLAYDRRGKRVEGEDRDRWLERLQKAPLVTEIDPASTEEIDQARLAIWARDYDRAHELLRQLAKQGDPAAQEELARLSFEGWGTEQSDTQAVEWFRKAIAKDYAPAHYNLARMYEQGRGLDRDPAKARVHFEAAAKLGHADAQGRLAFLLLDEPEPDYAAAARWFERASKGGHLDADYWLGRMAEEGWGAEADLARAFELYTGAAEAGQPDAQYRLALLYQDGRGVKADPDEAGKWAYRAAVQDSAEAQELVRSRYSPSAQAPKLSVPEKLDLEEMRKAMTP